MKKLLVLALFYTAFAADSFANGFDYAVEVKGMVCSFCAYNVSKQLRSLDGVVDHSAVSTLRMEL